MFSARLVRERAQAVLLFSVFALLCVCDAAVRVCCVNFAAISVRAGKQILYNKKGGGTSKRSNKVIK
jgi:hypothetical protein